MSIVGKIMGANNVEVSRLSNEHLLRRNAELRDEAARLRESNAELMRQLAEARTDSQVDRAARRAALNLLEDAIAARGAEQREYAERRRAEEGLRASEEKYRSLFESIDEGFFILEKVESGAGGPLDFRVVEANPAFAVQSGVVGIIGKTLREALPGEAEEWYLTLDKVFATGESIRFERELVSRSRVLELYAFRLADGLDDRMAVIFKDVSERRAVEDALRDADRRKDEFLAILAHELRNPLAPIRNALNILRITAGNDPDARDVRAIIERQVGQMVRLVEDLMEVSRITRGLIELRLEETDLATIVRGAVETSAPLVEAAGQSLAIALPRAPIPLYGDVVRLSQVFANLLNNAAKYSERGAEIALSACRAGSDVIVSIKDHGIGISASVLPTVFDMFTQADRSSSRVQGGLGIGLTVVKRLVEMHGGAISAHSDGLGQGTEFTVRLPAGTAHEEAASARAMIPPGAALADHRFLIVDDNVDSAASLGMLLRLLGAEVQTANNGSTALEIIADYRPDTVFLDIGMPVMDGYQVARRIRERAEFDRVILVALTGWGQAKDRDRTREAGFNHHLVKPADIAALQALL